MRRKWQRGCGRRRKRKRKNPIKPGKSAKNIELSELDFTDE